MQTFQKKGLETNMCLSGVSGIQRRLVGVEKKQINAGWDSCSSISLISGKLADDLELAVIDGESVEISTLFDKRNFYQYVNLRFELEEQEYIKSFYVVNGSPLMEDLGIVIGNNFISEYEKKEAPYCK